MPLVTQSRSNSMAQANQQSAQHLPHSSAVSMPGAFDPEDLLNLKIFLDLLNINKSANKEPARLDSNLDLLNHLACNVLHFPQNHLFKILAGFRHAVAGNKSPCILHMRARI